MYELRKKFTFEAAHMLPHHDGKCQRLHGHSWVGVLILRSTFLHYAGPKIGMLRDFGDIKAAVAPLVEQKLDHHYLNESIPELKSPTSEALAHWIFSQLKPVIEELYAVEIQETCTSSATYWGHE